MENADPATLDFEQFERLQREESDPAWRAAAAHGVDTLLLRRNLQLTPAQRLEQLEDALRLMGR
ncbi:MAG: hypothetical protein AAGA54_05330 [Myxococcota bacterium]